MTDDARDEQSQPGASADADAVPPPSHVQPESLSAAELAQIRVHKKRSLFHLPASSSRSRGSDDSQDARHTEPVSTPEERWEPELSSSPDAEDMPFIKVGGNIVYADELMENYDKDVYRWAVLYENQRGATVFSTAYYSRLSLLPIDPPAFTLPSTSKIVRGKSPALSLSTYPLPDGAWRWVSRAWMVDMRGDGQTQYDGFEYNWSFRTHNWRAQTGFMSAGGWVRRRRWVRLMVRPAINKRTTGDTFSEAASGLLEGILPRPDTGATRPPSVMVTADSESEDEKSWNEDVVWKGDVLGDWERCRRAMKKLDRDGRKLELWQRWLHELAPPEPEAVHELPVPRKQWTEDDTPLASQYDREGRATVDEKLAGDTGVVLDPAARDHVAQVLQVHGQDILQLFVYPDSRAQFIELITRAGLLADISGGLGGVSTMSMLDFWSSCQSLQNLVVDGAPS
ncbi:hypothetical protein PsYK624_021990 [Phanerochaete sordida]|uniref:TECPR1-like DysF domain-containing protein n=1 Tax=Phanerochaete sordida TaxID=48140 RepID=A0A9P3G1U8_9APHY|nr:hypothetical protein PsYK624_021990 [Phanerochaete sordida]